MAAPPPPPPFANGRAYIDLLRGVTKHFQFGALTRDPVIRNNIRNATGVLIGFLVTILASDRIVHRQDTVAGFPEYTWDMVVLEKPSRG